MVSSFAPAKAESNGIHSAEWLTGVQAQKEPRELYQLISCRWVIVGCVGAEEFNQGASKHLKEKHRKSKIDHSGRFSVVGT